MLVIALGTLLLASCGDKKEDTNIVTHKQTVVKKKQTERMTDIEQTRETQWLGATYAIAISRKADTSLPVITDELGNKYFDNTIRLKITREDGSVFVEKTFTKADFKQYVPDSYYTKGALLGVVFDKVEDNRLSFAASVGSPDKTSDEYVPLVLTIDRNGKMSVSEATTLDVDNGSTATQVAPSDEDGV